jgi:hypothetical protein
LIRMSAKTKLSPEEVVKRAVSFFGPGGYGLEVVDETTGYVCLEGGGGVVEVIASAEGKGASVELVSREWDYQVKEFLGDIS